MIPQGESFHAPGEDVVTKLEGGQDPNEREWSGPELGVVYICMPSPIISTEP